jgi:hypothetical protein
MDSFHDDGNQPVLPWVRRVLMSLLIGAMLLGIYLKNKGVI